MIYTIYALCDERQPEVVRYVGFSRDPERRFKGHLAEARWSKAVSHRLNWMRKVIGDSARILWRTLAVAETADEAAVIEIAAIADHVAGGHPLTNGTVGGEGVQGFGGVLSPEAMARRIASTHTPEYSAARSISSTRYWSSAETREQHRQAMKAHWASPEAESHREASSVVAKALWQNPSHGERVHTPDARAKMAAAKRGKPHARQRTAEWNAKIADAQKGKKRRPWTPEERERHMAAMNHEKMSASAKARWHVESVA